MDKTVHHGGIEPRPQRYSKEMTRAVMTILLMVSLVLAPAWRIGHAAGRPGESCCMTIEQVSLVDATAEPVDSLDTDELPCCAEENGVAEEPACSDNDTGCPAGTDGDCPCECCKVAPAMPLLVQHASGGTHVLTDASDPIPGAARAVSRALRPPSPPPKSA